MLMTMFGFDFNHSVPHTTYKRDILGGGEGVSLFEIPSFVTHVFVLKSDAELRKWQLPAVIRRRW